MAHTEIISPHSPDQLAQVAEIFKEYAQSLSVDLGFQGFEQELATLPGVVAGCCALRPLDGCDYANASEMKRLYVRSAFRGFGLGRELASRTLDLARQAGYSHVLLDTLDDMEAARSLYLELGFEEIPPYYHNPIAGAHYLKVDL